jgi:hypothetical protein
MNPLCVYVAGPYTLGHAEDPLAVLRNIAVGERACAILRRHGLAPYSPWADRTQIVSEVHDGGEALSVEAYQQASLAWMLRADAVIVLPGSGGSRGVARERAAATAAGIPVADWDGSDDALQAILARLRGRKRSTGGMTRAQS